MPQTTKLKVNILLEEKEGGGAIASVLEMPNYRVEAATPEQAIEELKVFLVTRLKNTKIFPVKINLPQVKQFENSWLKFAGVFKDDPDFAGIVQAIRAERQSEDDTEIEPSVYMVEN